MTSRLLHDPGFFLSSFLLWVVCIYCVVFNLTNKYCVDLCYPFLELNPSQYFTVYISMYVVFRNVA